MWTLSHLLTSDYFLVFVADQNKSENNIELYVSELGGHPIKWTQIKSHSTNSPLILSLVWNICCAERLFFFFKLSSQKHPDKKFHCNSHCTLLMCSLNIKQNIFFCKTSKWFNSWLDARPVRRLLSPVLAVSLFLFCFTSQIWIHIFAEAFELMVLRNWAHPVA